MSKETQKLHKISFDNSFTLDYDRHWICTIKKLYGEIIRTYIHIYTYINKKGKPSEWNQKKDKKKKGNNIDTSSRVSDE